MVLNTYMTNISVNVFIGLTFLLCSSISLALVMYNSLSWAFRSELVSNSTSACEIDVSKGSASAALALMIFVLIWKPQTPTFNQHTSKYRLGKFRSNLLRIYTKYHYFDFTVGYFRDDPWKWLQETQFNSLLDTKTTLDTEGANLKPKNIHVIITVTTWLLSQMDFWISIEI